MFFKMKKKLYLQPFNKERLLKYHESRLVSMKLVKFTVPVSTLRLEKADFSRIFSMKK